MEATLVFERSIREVLSRTYVVFVTLHVISERRAPELVGAKEAEVTWHLSGDGRDQALEEPQRALVPHDGSHHRPHGASDAEQTQINTLSG